MSRNVVMALLGGLLAAGVLLVMAWWQRHDPLDLWVIGVAFVGVALLLRLRQRSQVQLAVLALLGLITGVTASGVRDPLPALLLAVVFVGGQLLARRMLRGR